MIGYTGRDHELFELTVGVLGYYDETMGDFINPRLPPRAGTPIYVADSAMLARVLSKRAMGRKFAKSCPGACGYSSPYPRAKSPA